MPIAPYATTGAWRQWKCRQWRWWQLLAHDNNEDIDDNNDDDDHEFDDKEENEDGNNSNPDNKVMYKCSFDVQTYYFIICDDYFDLLVWVNCRQDKNKDNNVQTFIRKWKDKSFVCDIAHKGMTSICVIIWVFLENKYNYK